MNGEKKWGYELNIMYIFDSLVDFQPQKGWIYIFIDFFLYSIKNVYFNFNK